MIVMSDSLATSFFHDRCYFTSSSLCMVISYFLDFTFNCFAIGCRLTERDRCAETRELHPYVRIESGRDHMQLCR